MNQRTATRELTSVQTPVPVSCLSDHIGSLERRALEARIGAVRRRSFTPFFKPLPLHKDVTEHTRYRVWTCARCQPFQAPSGLFLATVFRAGNVIDDGLTDGIRGRAASWRPKMQQGPASLRG